MTGHWLANIAGDNRLDLGALAEASELGLDTRISGSVLSALRRDRPPSFAEAQAHAAALEERWAGGGPSPLGGAPAAARASHSRGGGTRSRSSSRGPPAPESLGPTTPPAPQRQTPGACAAAAVANLRPPRPSLPCSGGLRSQSPAGKMLPLRSAGASLVSGSSNSGDDSLVGGMAARLAQVEHLNQQLSAKVTAQTQELASLRAQMVGNDSGDSSGHAPGCGLTPPEVAALRAECARLRAQVEEMTKFMSEYGLCWVPRGSTEPAEVSGDVGSEQGGGSVSSSDVRRPRSGRYAAADRGSAGAAAGGDEITVDIKVLRSRVESLNAALEEQGAQVVDHPSGALGGRARGFASGSAGMLPLTFFADGIKLADFAFLPYSVPGAQKLIKEVLNGYVPTLLQEEHPDGVPLKVVDRTRNAFKAWLREFALTDPELVDGGERLKPSCGGSAIKDPSNARSPAERLLAKLPDRVVRGGRVCEIRGAIAESLNLGGGGARSRCASAPVPDGPAGSEAARPAPSAAAGGGGEVSLLASGREPSAPTARLQVKLETGHRVTLTMEPSHTVGALWEALEAWRSRNKIARAGADGRRCCLRTAFPPKSYSDFHQTLASAGLTPSATLFISAEAVSDR